MKKVMIASIISLAGSVMAFISMFFPFVLVPGYSSLSGIQLITNLYRSVSLKTEDSSLEGIHMFFRSSSVSLLVSLILFAVSGVLVAIYLSKKNKKIFDFSVVSTIIAFVFYAIQLSSNNLLISDFFGILTSAFENSDKTLSYCVPDISGDSLGIGAKMLAVFGALAVISIVMSKLFAYSEKIKMSQIQTPLSLAFKQFARNKLALLGLSVLGFLFLFCFYGPVFSSNALLATNVGIAQEPPSWQYIFGTDDCGRDIFSRIMYGGRISLEVGFVVVFVEIIIGTAVGGIAGYYGKFVDNILMRVVDIFLSLPMLPVIIILGAVMMDLQIPPEKRIYYIMVVLGIFFWPGLARLVRGQILTLREQEFMVAANALGLRDRTKIFGHLVPNAFPNVIVTATLDIGGVILYESVLSFLGLGVAIPFPSWGNIINAVNNPENYSRPWLWIPAGIMILITVLSINLVGDGLRDANDPKMKR